MKKIRWGIMAPGKIAAKFASDIKLVKDAELIAVASRDPERSRKFAKRFGIKNFYSNYSDLALDPEIDVVYIASPHSFHFEQTMLCLENNKHVLCEKPMGLNAAEVIQMAETAKAKNLFLMEALWTRFLPSYLKCRELTDKKKIGEIRSIHSDFGFKVEASTESRLLNKNLAGGCLLDIGIYPVFMALSLAGEPEEMIASSIIGPTGVDMATSVIFQYPSKQISALLSASFLASTSLETIITGTKGRIIMHRPWHATTLIELVKGERSTHFKFDEPGFGYQYEIAEVNKCILKGKVESDLFPQSHSILLHRTLERIRKEVGLLYPGEVNL